MTETSPETGRVEIVRAAQRGDPEAFAEKKVQRVMQAVAHPDVRLYRLHFLVEGPDGNALLPEFLPRDRGLAGAPKLIEDPVVDSHGGKDFVDDKPFERGELLATIVLARKSGEADTSIRLGDTDLGRGEPAFRTLGEDLAKMPLAKRATVGELNARAEVPYEDVIRALDAWHRAGGGTVRFVGAPPPEAARSGR